MINGLRHGYTEDDDQDTDNSHEFKGHGVTQAWVQKHAESGAKRRKDMGSLGKSYGRLTKGANKDRERLFGPRARANRKLGDNYTHAKRAVEGVMASRGMSVDNPNYPTRKGKAQREFHKGKNSVK